VNVVGCIPARGTGGNGPGRTRAVQACNPWRGARKEPGYARVEPRYHVHLRCRDACRGGAVGHRRGAGIPEAVLSRDVVHPRIGMDRRGTVRTPRPSPRASRGSRRPRRRTLPPTTPRPPRRQSRTTPDRLRPWPLGVRSRHGATHRRHDHATRRDRHVNTTRDRERPLSTAPQKLVTIPRRPHPPAPSPYRERGSKPYDFRALAPPLPVGRGGGGVRSRGDGYELAGTCTQKSSGPSGIFIASNDVPSR
jgi:hypothetical protein